MKRQTHKNSSIGVFGLLFFIFFLKSSVDVLGGSGIAITGIWNLSSTWNFNGIFRPPTCGDTLTIPAGITVTLDSQEDYTSCTQAMVIIVGGTLQLINGYKINLPCSSSVNILSGGILQKATPGGGNSTYIHICGCDAWTASQGTVNGPDMLNCSLLPVTFLSFTADLYRNDRILSWTTASEKNNDYFTVERSEDAYTFNSIAEIEGAGNSSIMKKYLFTDADASHGILYYRIKQTDFDGKYTYTKTIAVRKNNKKFFDLISAFVDQKFVLNLLFINYSSNEAIINLYDCAGNVVLLQMIKTLEGQNNIEIILPPIKNGIYFLSICDTEFNEKIYKNIVLN